MRIRKIAGHAKRTVFPSRSAVLWNPWRRAHPRQTAVARLLLWPLTRLILACGFVNIDYAYIHGNRARLHVGEHCSLTDTTFNLSSGEIYVGTDTVFSHGCYVLTGQHRFYNGRRAGLQPDAPYPEVPASGRDIRIGCGCFVGANASILGGVTIGDDVIVGAGAVVTKDIPAGSFVAGVPARVVNLGESAAPV
jgi:acetyltransferase-like isoleucine patch superfamily enzyme